MPTFSLPPTTDPTIVVQDHLVLTYPYTSPTLTINLKNPEFGNSNLLAFTRVQRESRGGTTIIFYDPLWPTTDSLTYNIRGMSGSEYDDLTNFIRTSLGKEIGLKDHQNQQWRGYITNPEMVFTNISKAICDTQYSSVSVNFEGALVSWP